MRRRDFIQYSLIGGGSFILNLGLYNPQSADAFILKFLFKSLLKNAFGFFQIRNEQWYKQRQEVMLAEREFIRQQFTNVAIAEVESPQYNIITASERQDPLANNVAFGFPRIELNEASIANIGGPAAVGMTYAAEYLKQNRNMNPGQVQASVLPKIEGGKSYSNMSGWSDSKSFNYYPNHYSYTGMRIRYDAVNPRPGGFGIISVSVNANQLIRIPEIRINFK